MILPTTIQTTLHNLTPEADAALAQTARLFQSARRTAYQRLKAGVDSDQLDHALRRQFGMDARFARDAVLEAQAVGAALRELLPDYLAATEAKMQKVEKRLQRSKLKPAAASVITGLENRLAKLKAKRDKWQAHLDAGTLPPVIFGGAEAFHARRLGEITKAEWRACRCAQFWSRGAEADKGNLHGRITATGEGFTISLATLPVIKGRLRYFSGDLWVPEGYRDLLRRSLVDSYSVRVLRAAEGWQVQVSVREQVPGEVLEQAPPRVCVSGLDCNTDCLTVAVASPQGNLLAHHTVWMRTLPDARSDAAENLISKALDEALKFAWELGAECLVIENLKFAQDHDTQPVFNRRTTRFRSTMVKLAARKALRLGLNVVQVNPAYSSIIGKHKYADGYGLSVHEAAAFVLARRGQGREERLPGKIVAQFPKLHDHLLTLALTKPPKDRQRHLYQKWANKLASWKEQANWSLWFVWNQVASLTG